MTFSLICPQYQIVELVTSQREMKDKTVRQYLIDSYSENLKKQTEKEGNDAEESGISEKDRKKAMKNVTKYPTPWHLQVCLLKESLLCWKLIYL